MPLEGARAAFDCLDMLARSAELRPRERRYPMKPIPANPTSSRPGWGFGDRWRIGEVNRVPLDLDAVRARRYCEDQVV
jgi:hypothetical protein